MLPETIIMQLKNQNDDNAAVKNFIMKCMESMSIIVEIPELDFDDDGHIINNGFWENIELKIVNHNILLDSDPTRFDFLANIFTETKEIRTIFQYWLKIAIFLSDMALRNVDLLIYFAASAGFVLVSQLMTVKRAATNNDIKQSFSLCIGCIDRVMVLVLEGRNSMYQLLSLDLQLDFLEIVQRKSMFLTPSTFNILRKNLRYKGDPTLSILDISHKFLKSRKQANKMSIFEFYNEEETKSNLEAVIIVGATAEKKKAILLTIDLVKFSKENNLAFECNWTAILQHIFSPNKTIKNLSMDLLIAKFKDVTEYSLLEIALEVFCYTDEETLGITTFIDIFEPHEVFNGTAKLFHLLQNTSMTIQKFEVIVAVLTALVKKSNVSATNYVERFSDMMASLFDCMNRVQNVPNLLCPLLNVVDITKFQGESRFNDKFANLRIVLTNLTYSSQTYEATIRLCRGLKKCSATQGDINEMYKNMFKDLHRENEINRSNASIRATCLRFLAADDVFDIFERVYPNDKYKIYKLLKKWFNDSNDREIKVLLSSLIVNMLTTYHSGAVEIPAMSKSFIEGEATVYRHYINFNIFDVDLKSVLNIFLCSAFCRLHTTYMVFPMESPLINKVYSILSTYMKDDNLRKEYSRFLLIVGLWNKLNQLLHKRSHITQTPHSLVMLWADMTDLCVYNNQFKIFIARIWEYDIGHKFFVDTFYKALYELNVINKSKALINKLSTMITDTSILGNVASLIAMKLISKKHDYPRVNMAFLEKTIEHLDTKCITFESREIVIKYLNDALRITDTEQEQHLIMQKFLKYFTDKRNSATATVASTETTRKLTATTSKPVVVESSSAKSRRTSSIPGVNVSIDTDSMNN